MKYLGIEFGSEPPSVSVRIGRRARQRLHLALRWQWQHAWRETDEGDVFIDFGPFSLEYFAGV